MGNDLRGYHNKKLPLNKITRLQKNLNKPYNPINKTCDTEHKRLYLEAWKENFGKLIKFSKDCVSNNIS